MAGLGTLREVRHEWTMVDLLDAHEALAVRAEMERLASEESRRKSER